MRIILKEEVENLGRKGDIVDVAPGYGRNYLIPKKMAIEVTSSNIKMIEIEKKALIKKFEKERLSYQELIKKLNQTTLSFRRKAGEKDVIFGSVSSSDIKDALNGLGFDIDRKKILLEEPVKRLGNYSVPIKIFHEDRAEIKIEVIKEEEIEPKEKGRKKETPEEEKKEAEKKAAPEAKVQAKEEEQKGEKKQKEEKEKGRKKEEVKKDIKEEKKEERAEGEEKSES